MTQKDALKILKIGANVFLTGAPGSGKTHTINQFVKYLRNNNINVAITASTGIAATHIGGMTIHSWSGIGIKKRLTDYDIDTIASSKHILNRINKTKVLIIDEVSMLRPSTLLMVDAVCREVKRNSESFGGLQVVFVGDFFQLPPIVRDEVENQPSLLTQKEGKFAYESDLWNNLKMIACYLTEQHRQDDKDFLSLLSAIRANKLEDKHFSSIQKRKEAVSDVKRDITKLFPHNADVDSVNSAELEILPGDKETFNMRSTGKENVVASLKKGCLSPETLELKIGATVMFTKNNQQKGFVNGTTGVVVNFDADNMYPIVKTKNGRIIETEPMDWMIEDGGRILAKITQIPLRLAWAITVHKSQGISLDSAVMNLANVFEYGQGYVALSRVRRLSGLFLLGINDKALMVHPEVLAKDKEFRTASINAEDEFEKMSLAEIEKMHDNFVRISGEKGGSF